MNAYFSKPLQRFLMNDQPITCPHCGARCEEIASFGHTNYQYYVQQCLDDRCGFICSEEEDEYSLKLWKII
jgi:hypothetical protein